MITNYQVVCILRIITNAVDKYFYLIIMITVYLSLRYNIFISNSNIEVSAKYSI